MILCDDPVRWSCAMTPCNDPVQWSCAMIMCDDHVQLSHVMILCNDPVEWSCAMIMCNERVQLSCAMIVCNYPVQWSCAMILCNDPVQWSCCRSPGSVRHRRVAQEWPCRRWPLVSWVSMRLFKAKLKPIFSDTYTNYSVWNCTILSYKDLKVNLNWCGWVFSTYTFIMWNVSMYSIFAYAEPFYILSFRCHCIIKTPEHAPEIFRSSCSWRSVPVLLYTSETHVFRNPRQYLVEQNQCDAKRLLSRPAFSLWRQHNVHVMEQWSKMRCCITRHLTSNFRTRYTQIMWFLFSATSYDLVCF